jgi:DNA repair photolyase
MGRRGRIIYEPSGAAAEYAPLAANLFEGCLHGCRYCYVPNVLRINRQTFHSRCRSRAGVFGLLEADVNRNSEQYRGREILLCFTSDPYQSPAAAVITRQVLKILGQEKLKFTVLSKGRFAFKDLDLLAEYQGRLGVSISFSDDLDRRRWEPEAAPLPLRADLLREARRRGIATWVSLEPVIYPDQALAVVAGLDPWVDRWMVGKLNHNLAGRGIDWRKFVTQIKERFKTLGADYYLKQSLKRFDDEEKKPGEKNCAPDEK